MPSDEILRPTLTLKVGEGETAEEFILRVPTPLEKAQLGVREAAIRRTLDPVGNGWAIGVDDETFFLIRGMAVLEVLLEKGNVRWPWSEVKPDDGPATLVVDITKFPPGKEGVIAEVGRQFHDALDRFHRGGAERQKPAVPEVVAGGGSPGAL